MAAAQQQQQRVVLAALCLLALASGAAAQCSITGQCTCTAGYFKLDLVGTTDTQDALARCLGSLQVKVYGNCSVALNPLNAAGSLVPAIWTGNGAETFVNYVECPNTEGRLIYPASSAPGNVRNAIAAAFEGHVYGFNSSGVARFPTKLVNVANPIVYANGLATMTRDTGAVLQYAITERTITAFQVSTAITVLAACSQLPDPTNQCRDDNSVPQGLGTPCPLGRIPVVTYDPNTGTPATAVAAACAICPAGTQGDGTGCTACNAGTVGGMEQAASPSGDCPTACGPGYYSVSGASHCRPCPKDTYSDGPTNAICTVCPVESYAWIPGSTACLRCVNGIPEACTGGVCASGLPPSPGSHIVQLGRMATCGLSGLFELRMYTKCTSWATASPTVQLGLVVSGDCSMDVFPITDPACADATSATGYGYGTIKMQAYYQTTSTIRTLLHPQDPSGPMMSITDSGSGTSLTVKFWAGTLDYAQANATNILSSTTCQPTSATVTGGQVAQRPSTPIAQCPAGSYSVVDSWPQQSTPDSVAQAYCYPCLQGYRCPGATGSHNGPITTCNPNEYNPYLGVSSCLTCSAGGAYTSYAGAAKCDVPKVDRDCYLNNWGGVGRQYDPVSQQCQPCAAGTARNETSKTCEQCPAGYYSGPGAPWCTPCPAGQYSPSLGMPDQEALTGIPGRKCLVCPRGSLALSGSQTASTVGVGQITTAATLCDACPAGFIQDTTDPLKPCVPCAQSDPVMGPYTYRTGDATPENNECVQIPAGFKLKPAGGGTVPNTEIIVCEAGRVSFWSDDGLVRTPQDEYNCIGCGDLVPAANFSNTYAPHEGMSDCIGCPAGTIPQNTALPGQRYTSSCGICQDGYYRDYYTRSATCLKCPASKEAGPFQQGDCTLCKPGSYMSSAMAASDTNFCAPCPRHYYRATAGGDSCLPCPRGTDTQNTGNTDCTPCALGYYNNLPGTSCDPAPAGAFVNTTSAWMYKLCPKGTWNDDTAEDSCNSCAGGRYSPTEGSKQCKTCPAGTFALAQSSNCTDCRAGYSSPPGSTTCNACKPGTFAPNPRAPFCLPCTKGFRCPTNAMRRVQPCPRGMFSSKEGSIQCTPCPANSISTGGGTSASPTAVISCSKW